MVDDLWNLLLLGSEEAPEASAPAPEAAPNILTTEERAGLRNSSSDDDADTRPKKKSRCHSPRTSYRAVGDHENNQLSLECSMRCDEIDQRIVQSYFQEFRLVTDGCVAATGSCVDSVEERCANAISGCPVKFYIGICADPLLRAGDVHIGHWQKYGHMRLLAFGDSDHIVRLEKRLINRFKGDPRMLNQRKGGGGRCPSGVPEFLYVCRDDGLSY